MGQGQSNSPARPGQPAQVKPQTAEEIAKEKATAEKKIAKHEKSKKLAENRITAALRQIDLLGNLGSTNYALTDEEKVQLVHGIKDAAARLETRLSEPYAAVKERWHFE